MAKIGITYVYDTKGKNILLETNCRLNDAPKHIGHFIQAMAKFYGISMDEITELINSYCLKEINKRKKEKHRQIASA